MHFKENILLYTLIPLLILTVAATYYRFMVLHDYTVAYEGECDPHESSCFVECEDDECLNKYYFTKIQRNASALLAICGESIVGCDDSNVCAVGEKECSVTFCRLDLGEECETFIDNSNLNFDTQ